VYVCVSVLRATVGAVEGFIYGQFEATILRGRAERPPFEVGAFEAGQSARLPYPLLEPPSGVKSEQASSRRQSACAPGGARRSWYWVIEAIISIDSTTYWQV
jgi:hypothetical protein